ncbi:MAG: D-alanyl-D-alanine carboxypeptidase [Firmicutes bacterium]|nr:D-alanyl-D-alanine carboxypeptidase [Bacillota bacterium]
MPQAAALDSPVLDAKCALLMDETAGRMLYGHNEKEKAYPASITKVMTALLTLEAVDRGDLSISQPITASHLAVTSIDEDSSTAGIEAGEVLTVEQLLNCLLIVSANEAANVLAEAVFIAREAMKHDLFMTICGSKSYDVPATNMSDVRELHSTNALISNWRTLGYIYDYADGLKTGYTDEAGRCLLASAIKDGRRLISVVLGCTTKEVNGETRLMNFVDSATLLDWGYNNFTVQTVFTKDDLIQEIPVLLSKETNAVLVHTAEDVNILLPNDVTTDMLERKVTVYGDTAFAPIEAGQELGEMTLSYDGYDYATVKLLAADSVSVNRFLQGKYLLSQFFSKPLVKILTVVVILLVLAVVVWVRMLRPKSRYGSRGRRNRGTRNYRGRRR